MKKIHIAQDVTASFWNAATVLLIPPPQLFSYPVVHPASSLPSDFPSSAASRSIRIGTQD